MAEQNVPTQPPTRTDEQIVPRSQWLTIGKSNLLFNAQKIQKNPIFQISVDILSNTNFFQAFTASANVPAIYLQQFWNTMKYNEKTGVYSCQVDEQCGESSLRTNVDMQPDMGRVYTKGSDIFLIPTQSQSQSEEPKEESNSSPHQFFYDELKVKREAATPKGDKDQGEVDTSTGNQDHQTVTSTPPVIAPFTDVSSTKPSSLVTTPPINTEATTITTSLPEITPFIALQLRVARLEQEMSEVKKTDHSADVLASIKSQVPTASVKNQESEKSPKEIIRAKKEQGEEKQDSTYSIRSTDKLKTRMDKEVADKVKDHKRKHDSDDDEDDDDDEGPSAGSNQGRSTKRRRSDSAASGSAQPPPKDDDQSSKKPRESDPESEHSEQSSDDIPMQDEGNDSDMEDTDNAHIPKVSTTMWFKPIPESERPATPEPEWTIPPNDFPEPENNWANTYATTYKVPEENKLQRKTYDIGSFIKWFCRRTGKKKLCKADLEGPAFNLVKAFHKNNVFLQYQMDECHKLVTNKVDLSNPEGHQILRNIYEPLPLMEGSTSSGDKEQKIALSISNSKSLVSRHWPMKISSILWVKSETNMTSVRSMASLTGGLGERNSTSINSESPLIVKQSDRRCEFSVSSTKRAWRLGSVRDDKQKKPRTYHCNREKTTDQKDLSKSRKLCWRKNKRY
ncbi:hypothetical protein Tco_0151251 [Tanacetum coccineum]